MPELYSLKIDIDTWSIRTGQRHSRISIRQSVDGRERLKYHYTDPENVGFRWGRHPHNEDYIHVPDLEHYHPPPDVLGCT